MELILNEETIRAFRAELCRRECAAGTISQYVRTLRRLAGKLANEKITFESLQRWKETIAKQLSASTVNTMIAAINAWANFSGAPELKLKTLRVQRSTFVEDQLTEADFHVLLDKAKTLANETPAVLLQVMAATGVRVSELPYLTVEAARNGVAEVRLKGKTRRIPLGETVCLTLLRYAEGRGIAAGPVFLGAHGKPLDRRRIWEMFKSLCKGTGVDPKRMRPHALRHLFARAFYGMTRDIAKLSDLLGHSSINTTRIYIATSCTEHRALMEQLSLKIGIKNRPFQAAKRTKFIFCPPNHMA